MSATHATDVHHIVLSMLLAVRPRLVALDIKPRRRRAAVMGEIAHSRPRLRRCASWGGSVRGMSIARGRRWVELCTPAVVGTNSKTKWI